MQIQLYRVVRSGVRGHIDMEMMIREVFLDKVGRVQRRHPLVQVCNVAKILIHFWNQCFFACLEPIEHNWGWFHFFQWVLL